MSIKLSDVYCDARRTIEGALASADRLSLKQYGYMRALVCDVSYYSIVDVGDEEGYANIDMTIGYKERVINKEERFETVDKVKNIRVLNNYWDNMWTFNMINKIWAGDYPSSVAVDLDTGEVYLFNVRVSSLELVEFGWLTGTQFEAFMDSWNDREPFRIMLDESAMFSFIDGAEGYNHLRDTLYIEFNCISRLRVYKGKTGVI